jgi:HTH-type transcriptional regulator/antitoxin HigA
MAKPIHPIRTKADHEAALLEIERLWDAEVGTPEYDRLDVLGTLVDAYEREHTPIPPPDPVDAILFAAEQRGLSRKDLEEFIGTRARVSEVLTRARSLSIGMIRKLHEGLGIPAEALIAESQHLHKIAKRVLVRAAKHGAPPPPPLSPNRKARRDERGTRRDARR